MTSIQASRKSWPQFELQVLRESISSVTAHVNEAFTKEESDNEYRTQGVQSKPVNEKNSGEFTDKIRNERNQRDAIPKRTDDIKEMKQLSNSPQKVITGSA